MFPECSRDKLFGVVVIWKYRCSEGLRCIRWLKCRCSADPGFVIWLKRLVLLGLPDVDCLCCSSGPGSGDVDCLCCSSGPGSGDVVVLKGSSGADFAR